MTRAVLLGGPGLRYRLRPDRYSFVCPVCKKTFEYDEPYEPMCTGPSESRDDHEPTVMIPKHMHEIRLGRGIDSPVIQIAGRLVT